ncbi:MAG: DUF4445 domain-containing protein, partial [Treponema sp.]|nr:DUF4445 domain-containing protein [Treponema sp.]
PGLFGFESDASVYFSVPELKDASVYFPPAVSAFCGPDLVSSIISALDFSEPSFIADAGTNCEMAFYDSAVKRLTCTSSAAGPAFEARGISSGMTACEGAVEDVVPDGNGNFTLSVIGGTSPKGFCGSGLLSAVSFLYEKGEIDRNGTFVLQDKDRFDFSEGVSLLQEDIRNFQLAKSAVASGLSLLYSECGLSKKYPLFLCGGFGRRMNAAAAEKTGLVPPFAKKVVSCGNTALRGAALFLSDDALRKKASELSGTARVLELPDIPSFSEVFIKNINFPPLK